MGRNSIVYSPEVTICPRQLTTRSDLSSSGVPVGDSTVTCTQAERVFDVTVTVRPTPNPSFSRVDAQVMQGGYSLLRFSTVVGRY